MQQILLFILLGLGSGALIAAIALGVVVSYRGSGVINLATGGVAMLAGYAFWALRTGRLGPQLGTAPALALSLVFVLAVGVAIEFVAFRPLRAATPLAKLVASLGVLLVAQASMLLAFGTPSSRSRWCCRRTRWRCSARSSRSTAHPRGHRDRGGGRAGGALPVGAVRAGDAGGVGERDRGHALRPVAQFGLAGEHADRVANRRRGRDPGRRDHRARPGHAAAADRARAGRGAARPVHVVRDRLCRGLGLGILDSLIDYASAQTWFPTSGGAAIPGVQELVTFLIIILAMFLRGAQLPGRGELVEQRLRGAAAEHLAVISLPLTAVCAVALVLLPFDFREPSSPR